jgi:UDP-galactopyranose mutase
LQRYVDVARNEANVTFVGRLGTYRYLDMDVTINEALITADKFLACAKEKTAMPAFVIDPLG